MVFAASALSLFPTLFLLSCGRSSLRPPRPPFFPHSLCCLSLSLSLPRGGFPASSTVKCVFLSLRLREPYWLPPTAGANFTQPIEETFALHCTSWRKCERGGRGVLDGRTNQRREKPQPSFVPLLSLFLSGVGWTAAGLSTGEIF